MYVQSCKRLCGFKIISDSIMHAIGEYLNRNREITNTFLEDFVFEMHKNAEN